MGNCLFVPSCLLTLLLVALWVLRFRADRARLTVNRSLRGCRLLIYEFWLPFRVVLTGRPAIMFRVARMKSCRNGPLARIRYYVGLVVRVWTKFR